MVLELQGPRLTSLHNDLSTLNTFSSLFFIYGGIFVVLLCFVLIFSSVKQGNFHTTGKLRGFEDVVCMELMC